jgi:hypothetical protein
VGTNNTGDVGWEHGVEWAKMLTENIQPAINKASCDVRKNCNYASRVAIVGAIDIEAFFFNPDFDVNADENRLHRENRERTKQWVNGFSTTTPRRYFNYGECSNCGNDVFTPLPGVTYEEHEYLWYVSWGVPSAFVIPEIYDKYGVNAYQWRNLSRYAALRHEGKIFFSGTLTQWNACKPEIANLRNSKCADDKALEFLTNNQPHTGWLQLFYALYNDPLTRQSSLFWSTDITWDCRRTPPVTPDSSPCTK